MAMEAVVTTDDGRRFKGQELETDHREDSRTVTISNLSLDFSACAYGHKHDIELLHREGRAVTRYVGTRVEKACLMPDPPVGEADGSTPAVGSIRVVFKQAEDVVDTNEKNTLR